MNQSIHLPQTADPALVRRLNTAVILDFLRLFAPLSRAEISSRTGLTRSTVSSIINHLVKQGLVREIDYQKDKLGRPGMLLELDATGACAIGVEVGVNFLSIMLADFCAKPIWRKRVAIDPEIAQSDFIQAVEALIQEALTESKRTSSSLLGIGVGVPGLVDVQQGELVFAPNLKWRHVPLRRILMEHFDIPVFVENDANAAALGEYYFGVARSVKNFIYLSADMGLGSGIILGGKLFRGNSGYAGEVGHMAFDPNGDLCGCGRRGCWESLVSPRVVVHNIQNALRNGSPSLIRELAQGDINHITFDQVIEAAQANDDLAQSVLRDVARWLGIGIANLVNAFNPELIVLGGGLARASKILIPVVEEIVHQDALAQSRAALKIAISAYGSEACIVGAAAIVLDEILRYPVP